MREGGKEEGSEGGRERGQGGREVREGEHQGPREI